MKKFSVLSLIFIFCLLSVTEAEAQRKKRKRPRDRDRTEEYSQSNFKENLIYEIGFGNPTFFSGGGGSQFNMALKPAAGYKFTDRLASGIFIKGDLVFVNSFGVENTFLDYGTGIFAKFKVIEALYLRGEYAYQNYDSTAGRFDFTEPLLGLGYRQGAGKWTFNLELLFHMDRDVRDFTGQVYEFWLQAGYNF